VVAVVLVNRIPKYAMQEVFQAVYYAFSIRELPLLKEGDSLSSKGKSKGEIASVPLTAKHPQLARRKAKDKSEFVAGCGWIRRSAFRFR